MGSECCYRGFVQVPAPTKRFKLELIGFLKRVFLFERYNCLTSLLLHQTMLVIITIMLQIVHTTYADVICKKSWNMWIPCVIDSRRWIRKLLKIDKGDLQRASLEVRLTRKGKTKYINETQIKYFNKITYVQKSWKTLLMLN